MDIKAMQQQVAELNAAIEAEKERARKAEQEARHKAEAEKHAAHYATLFSEIGSGVAGLNEVQHRIVYAAAWDAGHASGYAQVEYHYGEFADMARNILDAQ